jgi:hypothetical protein
VVVLLCSICWYAVQFFYIACGREQQNCSTFQLRKLGLPMCCSCIALQHMLLWSIYFQFVLFSTEISISTSTLKTNNVATNKHTYYNILHALPPPLRKKKEIKSIWFIYAIYYQNDTEIFVSYLLKNPSAIHYPLEGTTTKLTPTSPKKSMKITGKTKNYFPQLGSYSPELGI